MSETELALPPKFSFDEFYEMLKEYVHDPEAREALATYDAEDVAGHGELSNASVCSDLAFDSFGTFKMIGWSILVKHGWPTYWDMIQATKQDHHCGWSSSMWDQAFGISRAVLFARSQSRGAGLFKMKISILIIVGLY